MATQPSNGSGLATIPGSPADFESLASYWKTAAGQFATLKKPETNAIGASAQNLSAAYGDLLVAFSQAQGACDHLHTICIGWATALRSYQESVQSQLRTIEYAQETIAETQQKYDDLQHSKADDKDDLAISYQKKFTESQLLLNGAMSQYMSTMASYSVTLNSFKTSYYAPSLGVISLNTTSSSPLGRRIFATIGQLQEDYPDQAKVLGFIKNMLPFKDSGQVKNSLFWKDIPFAIGGMSKTLLESVRLSTAPNHAGKVNKALAKLGMAEPVYFHNPIRDGLKLKSTHFRAQLDASTRLEDMLKARMMSTAKVHGQAMKPLLKNLDETAKAGAQAIKSAFPTFNIEKLNKDKTSELFAQNSEYLAKKLASVTDETLAAILPSSLVKLPKVEAALPKVTEALGKTAKQLPGALKFTKHIPAVGNLISLGTNYCDYYEQDTMGGSEGEKRARAAGASVATTGSGIVGGAAVGAMVGSIIPGPGTVIGGVVGAAVGGLVGGWAGEEAAKATGFDDFAADLAGGIYKHFTGK